MRLGANTKAALLYVLPALAVFGVWFILLFVGNSSAVTPASTLAFVLTESPSPLWFRWLLVLPVLCAALAIAYLSRLTRTRVGSIALLCCGVALAGVAWLTVSAEIALFVSLPVLYGFVVVKEQAFRSERGT
jgi:hypothetical protein